MSGLRVLSTGPQVTVQDLGRRGWIAEGLSRGGAMDVDALHEGAALLRQNAGLAALEMAGTGGTFVAEGDLRIALTGAPMRARIDGAAVSWAASHDLPDGARLEIGPAEAGLYGYLHLGGGVDVAPVLGGRGAHLAAGVGAPLAQGDVVPAGSEDGPTGLKLTPEARFSGGTIRVAPSLQTAFFPEETRTRFEQTAFAKDPRSNRHGARL